MANPMGMEWEGNEMDGPGKIKKMTGKQTGSDLSDAAGRVLRLTDLPKHFSLPPV